MIKFMIIGNLGKDATVNNVNGRPVINFSVGNNEKWTDQNGQPQEKTTWAECGYWTDKTGIVPYLTKGTQVYVEGSVESKGYQKQDGTIGSSLIVRVSKVELLGSKPQQNGQYQPQYQQPAAQGYAPQPYPPTNYPQQSPPPPPPPPPQYPTPGYAPVRQGDMNPGAGNYQPPYGSPPPQPQRQGPPQPPPTAYPPQPGVTGELPF